MIDSEDEAEAEIATDVIGTDEEEVGAEALVVDLLEVEAVIVPLMTIALSLRNVLTSQTIAQNSLGVPIETEAVEAAATEASREASGAIEAKDVTEETIEEKSVNDVEIEVERGVVLGKDGKAYVRNQLQVVISSTPELLFTDQITDGLIYSCPLHLSKITTNFYYSYNSLLSASIDVKCLFIINLFSSVNVCLDMIFYDIPNCSV